MNVYDPSSDVGSTSTQALRLQSLSNVGEPGLWVFRVGEGDIQSGGEYGTKGRPRSHAPPPKQHNIIPMPMECIHAYNMYMCTYLYYDKHVYICTHTSQSSCICIIL